MVLPSTPWVSWTKYPTTSTARSTVPLRLNIDSRPSADSGDVTAFETTAWSAVQFRLAAIGRASSEGNTVRKEDAVGRIAVTFIATPTASDGRMQLPFAP